MAAQRIDQGQNHLPRMEIVRNADGSVDVGRVDGGGETVGGVVTDPDGILFGLELLDANNGSEDLLLDNLHVRGDVSEDGGLDVVALVTVALTTDQEVRTVLLTLIDEAHDPVELRLGDLGTLESVLVEGVADLVGRRPLLEALNKLVVDALLNEETRTGTAALAVVEKDTEVGPGDGVINICIIEDDVGRLAAQLQRDLLQVALRGGLEDGAANSGRTREGDLVDAHVRCDGGTRNATKTGDDVDHTRRESRLLAQLSRVESRQRSLLSCLEDDGVTGCNGGTDLPRPHHQREVPGDDLTADTDGLMSSIGHVVRVRVNRLTRNLVCPTAVVADASRRVGDVDLGEEERLAVVEGLNGGEDISIPLHQVGQLDQHATPVGWGRVLPAALECLAGSSDGNIHILLRSLMDGDNGLLIVGVDSLEGLVLDTLHPLTIDEPVPVSIMPWDTAAEHRASATWGEEGDTYSPVGCSYLTVGVVMVVKRLEDMMDRQDIAVYLGGIRVSQKRD